MGLDNPLHIAFLLVIMLLVFGARRLPEMGRSLGEGLRGFKSSLEGTAAPHGLTGPAVQAPPLQASPVQVPAVQAPPLQAPPVQVPAVQAPAVAGRP